MRRSEGLTEGMTSAVGLSGGPVTLGCRDVKHIRNATIVYDAWALALPFPHMLAA